ncbi:MAG: NAD-dependent epimerase/dehydratase family protein [Verrucomicrobia bacterium]|nr:NAD-dependent epimerase/dehydratase family protein [Verrucomicrobiota bacterium]
MAGRYDQLAETLRPAGSCDVLINYSIVKHGSVEENLRLADQVIAAARALEVRRLIHISSISVLPAVSGTVDEQTPVVVHRWKGVYSKVKVAVEQHFEAVVQERMLLVVRPGFILGAGLADSLSGIGRRLPTGQMLGLGNRRSIIPLVSRAHCNEALARMVDAPLTGNHHRFMMVAPDAPDRAAYVGFHCHALGRGTRALHCPAWLWRLGLGLVSIPLSLLRRRHERLVKLFEHNLNVRQYDCAQTSRALGVDFRFDWQAALREVAGVGPSTGWPAANETVPPTQPGQVHYVGLGRIVQQKHLPGLARNGFTGTLSWTDPARTTPPAASVALSPQSGWPAAASHVVITAPCQAREAVYASLPPSVQEVLIEKPFATSAVQLARHRELLGARRAYVMHNYRLKPNVLAFRRYLGERPAGALRWVTLHYETPSPWHEQVAWMRAEWRHRILVTDYAIHYLDLAWSLFDGPMVIQRCQTRRNARGELASVAADVAFPGGACSLFLRQGAHQRQCLIEFVFENYTAQLRFYPDMFQPVLGGHTGLDDARLALRSLMATAHKVGEKLGWRAHDRSHDQILGAFTGTAEPAALGEFSLPALMPFYERLTRFADEVYRE